MISWSFDETVFSGSKHYLLGKVELTFEKCLEMNQNRQMYYAYSSVRKWKNFTSKFWLYNTFSTADKCAGMKIESRNELQVECEVMLASFELCEVGLNLRTAPKCGGRLFHFLPSSTCLPLSLLFFFLFSSFLSQSFLSLYSFTTIKFLGRYRRNFFSFYCGN